jgi:hypothetical protein
MKVQGTKTYCMQYVFIKNDHKQFNGCVQFAPGLSAQCINNAGLFNKDFGLQFLYNSFVV